MYIKKPACVRSPDARWFSILLSALPGVQRPRQADAPAGLAADLGEEVFGGGAAHGVRLVTGGGDADGAEGAVVAVVEAHDGDVLRHALARAQERPDQVERDLVVVADDRRAAAQLLPQKILQHAFVLQLDELIALEAGEPEEIFIEREKPRVAHRADHAVIPLRPLRIVGFEDPGDFFMSISDQMPGQQIPAAVIVVADAERVGQLPAASVQESHGQSALPERLIELGVRIRQRRLAALDQDPRRGIEQQLLQEFAKRLHTQLIAFIPRDVIVNKAENNRQTVLQYAPESAQAGVYRKLAHDIWHNENMAIPTPMSFEELEKLVAVIRSREISLTLFYQAMSQCKALYKDHSETIMGNMDSIVFLGGREASTLKDISENWLGKATISMQTEGRSRGQSESYSQNMQRLGRELMTTSEITTMPGDKCILQLRGLPPFLSPKYDLKKHPNYKYTAEFDKKKNAFRLESLFRHRPLRLKPEDEYTVYEVDGSDTDEEADLLNFDDLDSDEFV